MQRPSSDMINVKIHGIEAHAGLCPENGISAIKIASEAISNMNLGRIDYETTSNIGYINGGKAINIVPNYVELNGEARSHNEDKLKDQIKHMSNCFYNAASNYTLSNADEVIKPIVDITVNRIYDKMDVSSSSRITKIIDQSVKNLGHSIVHHTSGGGCDANFINQKGIECVNLGTGMYELHTVNEYVVLDEFFRSAAIVLEAIKLNTHLN